MMMLNAFGRDRSLGLAVASVRDYREAARRRLPRQMFDYIDGGAYEEATLAANTADLEAISLRQRVMRDVSNRSMGTTVLGERLELPVILAPVGLAGMFAARAEVQAARAAERAGVSFVESTVSICSVEEVAQATERPPWFLSVSYTHLDVYKRQPHTRLRIDAGNTIVRHAPVATISVSWSKLRATRSLTRSS